MADESAKSDESGEEQPSGKPTVENRWWAELGRANDRPAPKRAPSLAGDQFFKIAEGYDQDRARDNLTDNNLRLLHQANPAEGEWSYLQMLPSKFPQRELERIQRTINLPPYARGVVVDCGRTIRLLVTGTPMGERVLELALVEPPSFDCWIKDEWVQEELYDNRNSALARFRHQIQKYIAPESIALYESIRAQA